jgi:hypothetical protein
MCDLAEDKGRDITTAAAFAFSNRACGLSKGNVRHSVPVHFVRRPYQAASAESNRSAVHQVRKTTSKGRLAPFVARAIGLARRGVCATRPRTRKLNTHDIDPDRLSRIAPRKRQAPRGSTDGGLFTGVIFS